MSSSTEMESDTVFFTLMPAFPYKEGSKINTNEFLLASTGVVQLIEKFGKVFAPVKYDMSGNIVKLRAKYEEDTNRYAFIEDMITHEQEGGGELAITSLLWLRRGLHFMQRFLEALLEDEARASCISSYMRVAYGETLERYHGWMGVQLFNILSRFAPTRQEFIKMLRLHEDVPEQEILLEMALFVSSLDKCVEQLTIFYAEKGLENEDRA